MVEARVIRGRMKLAVRMSANGVVYTGPTGTTDKHTEGDTTRKGRRRARCDDAGPLSVASALFLRQGYGLSGV